MSAEINYKNKYLALRGKYMNDLDMAFRLGFEQGQQQAQQDQAMQAQQEQAQMDQMMAQAQSGAAPGQEGQPGEAAPGEQPMEAPAVGGGSELDQHIAKLESMLNGSGAGADPEIKKSIESLKSLRKAELEKSQLRKSDQAVKGIVKALHKPQYKVSALANHNLSTNAKTAVSMQHKIVNDVMSKMQEEEKRASSEIKNILSVEGITKKE